MAEVVAEKQTIVVCSVCEPWVVGERVRAQIITTANDELTCDICGERIQPNTEYYAVNHPELSA